MFIDDLTGTLSAADKASIQDAQAGSGFDVKILIESSPSRGALDAQVGKMVTSANTLAIGVDPEHHYTFTHFGVGTGIPSSSFQSVARAGNGEFKLGHWGEGIKAIVANAGAARQVAKSPAATATIVVPTQTVTVEHPFPVLPLVAGAAALAIGFVLFWLWAKRRQRDIAATFGDFKAETEKLRTRNEEEGEWHKRFQALANNPSPEPAAAKAAQPPAEPYRGYASVPPAPAPAPRPTVRHVHHHVPPPAPPIVISGHNSGSDLLTGMAIGNMMSRPSVIERERVIERDPPRYEPRERTPAPAPSFSSSSSWGSDSSSSSGSSSSDFGSGFDSGGGGGGFDSGGGGFDGGGGGGDF